MSPRVSSVRRALAGTGVVVLMAGMAVGEHHVVNDALHTTVPAASPSATPTAYTPPKHFDTKACPWVTSRTESVTTRVAQLEAKATKAQLAGLLYLQGGDATYPYEGYTEAVPALCLPRLTEDDDRIGVHSLGLNSSMLPAPTNLAASFDAALAGIYGRVLGSQAHSQGLDFASSTMVNVVRSSDFGRTSEVVGGEDPLLNSVLGASELAGVQSQGVGAILLHMAAYAQADGRAVPGDSDSIVSPTALNEVYLAPFEAIVRADHPAGVMAAYNSVDGVAAAADVEFHDDLVRWSGSSYAPFVRSDCLLLPDDQKGEIAADLSQSKCGPNNEPAVMVKLPKSVLERLATPFLAAAFRFGLIQHPLSGQPADLSARQLSTAQQVALRTSEEGSVLLQNRRQVLPLSADDRIALIGNDAYPASQGSLEVSPSAGLVDDRAGLSRLVGKRRLDYVAIPPDATVAKGQGPWGGDPSGQVISPATISKAVSAARHARVAVVVASIQSSEWWDHTTLQLLPDQVRLIDAVAKVNPRTVVVLNTGGAVITSGWGSRVAGIVWQSYPGEEGGTALAALLSGQVNFSGHLPVTWPASDSAQPAEVGTAQFDPKKLGPVQFSEGVNVGYRWYVEHHVRPEYFFGYGLDYSSYQFLSEKATVGAGDTVTVTGRIDNTSSRAGTDVAQLYLTRQPAATGAPSISLVGFARVAVGAKGTATFSIKVPAGDMATWDQKSNSYVVTAGTYQLSLGGSAGYLPQRAAVHLQGERGLAGITVSEGAG
jgi:beta-glucosidase